MKNYKVQRMDEMSYNAYMCGSNNYTMEELVIAANNPEEAIQIAEATNYIVNRGYVRETDEPATYTRELEAERLIAEAERLMDTARKLREKANALLD